LARRYVTFCQAHADQDEAGLAEAGPARIGGRNDGLTVLSPQVSPLSLPADARKCSAGFFVPADRRNDHDDKDDRDEED
jgi:hypothetical protein